MRHERYVIITPSGRYIIYSLYHTCCIKYYYLSVSIWLEGTEQGYITKKNWFAITKKFIFSNLITGDSYLFRLNIGPTSPTGLQPIDICRHFQNPLRKNTYYLMRNILIILKYYKFMLDFQYVWDIINLSNSDCCNCCVIVGAKNLCYCFVWKMYESGAVRWKNRVNNRSYFRSVKSSSICKPSRASIYIIQGQTTPNYYSVTITFQLSWLTVYSPFYI